MIRPFGSVRPVRMYTEGFLKAFSKCITWEIIMVYIDSK